MIEATVLDYGVGNLHSLAKALERSGARVRVTAEPRDLAAAACVVLPGVGSAGRVMAQIAPAAEALRAKLESGVPALGVCVGMQVLFEECEEGNARGLGLFPGVVRRLEAPVLPNIGWCPVSHDGGPLFESIRRREDFYFVHSYAAPPAGAIATADCGGLFAAAIRTGNVFGVQFHPEKSSAAGLALLRNFVKFAESAA
ncbi:MAG: imidazole glycerol phosphate synthase subunit HisH [Planctomycetia bacterium]|nr:imidazole glycerol phosphate synthase subunit HisH [Planctomycetia bacterium]